MIRHIVMWKFKPEAAGKSREENMEKVKRDLLALVQIIPEIKRMEIGFDITHSDMSMDLLLLTEFSSVEDMKIYANHQEHLKVSAFVRSVIETRVVLDCEI